MAASELVHVTEDFKKQFPWLIEAKFFERLESTQTRIVQWLPKEANGAVVVVAESQTKGVGRQGRTWVSPPGGIWFTVAFPIKDLSPIQLGAFSIVAALEVANALKEVYNLECGIKWPNDIRYSGKKLGGILLNTTAKFKRSWLLIGIGINVNNEVTSEMGDATSIKIIRGQFQGRGRLIEALLGRLWNAWEEFNRTGFGPYKTMVESKLTDVGKTIKVLLGKKTTQGTLMGIDIQGGLLLKSNAKTQTINAGEIVGVL